MIIGIDPGISGAIALIRGPDVLLFDMPVQAKLTGKGAQIDAHGLSRVLELYREAETYIEKVAAMPGQGVTSMFGFGRSAGVIDGVCAALNLHTMHLSAQTWKKAAGLISKDKDASRTLATNLYPQAAHLLQRKKDIGRADALLIAHFGHQLSNKER